MIFLKRVRFYFFTKTFLVRFSITFQSVTQVLVWYIKSFILFCRNLRVFERLQVPLIMVTKQIFKTQGNFPLQTFANFLQSKFSSEKVSYNQNMFRNQNMFWCPNMFWYLNMLRKHAQKTCSEISTCSEFRTCSEISNAQKTEHVQKTEIIDKTLRTSLIMFQLVSFLLK